MTALTELAFGLLDGDESLLPGSEFGRLVFFASGDVVIGESRQSSLQPGFDFDTTALTFGADYRLRDDLFVGAAVGYGKVEADFARDAGSLSSNGWFITGYASLAREKFYVDGLLAFGSSDHESARNIRYDNALDVVDRTSLGETDGRHWSLGLESGMNFAKNRWLFNPNISLYYADVRIDGFSETGAQGLDLEYQKQGNDSLTVSGGSSISYTVTTEAMVLIPQLRIDFVREFEDATHIVNARFVNDPFASEEPSTSTLRIYSDVPDDSYVTIGLSLSAQFARGFSAFIDWQTLSGYDSLSSSSYSLGLRWERLF